jgi:spoIIIJ-associated protein
MPIADKVAAANQLNEFLKGVVRYGGFQLKYRITVDPVLEDYSDWDPPEILVEFAGPDSTVLLARNAELLRSLELLSTNALRLHAGEHGKVSFDCGNQRALRLQELRTAANVAAEKVRRTGTPYAFAPLNSRERRMVHLALRDAADLHTESEGEGRERHLVVYPKDRAPMHDD